MKTWSLNAKIIFVLSIFVTASIAISVIGVSKINSVNEALNYVTGSITRRVTYAEEMAATVNEIKNQEKVFVLEENHELLPEVGKKIDSLVENVENTIAEYDKIATEQGRKDLQELAHTFGQWKPIDAEIRKLGLAGRDKEAAVLARTKSVEILRSFDKLLIDLIDRNQKFMAEEKKKTDEMATAARNFMIIVSSFAILLGLLLAFFILRALSRAIDQVISSLNDNSSQVTSAAQQIAASSEQLSQAATEQASSLEETASSIEEMNSMVQKNSENARKSSEVSTTSHEAASKGKEVVQDMIRAIEDINASNQQIAEIVKVIGDIGNKTKVINDIVFQTKLLSFNASVEAARAGEHGKGFAVVAEEVGKLAQMSGNAAKEISTMLDGSMQKVEGIVNETKVKVESGTKIAQQCGEVLGDIVTNVSNVNQMVNEISTACQEQSQGVQEITKAMSQLDQVTQENASTSEEAASAAEELAAQAESLRSVVRTLIQTVKGGQDSAHQTAQATEPGVLKAQPAHTAPAQGEGSKVVHLKNSTSRKSARAKGGHNPAHSHELKKAVGMESAVPSENDPRFNDV